VEEEYAVEESVKHDSRVALSGLKQDLPNPPNDVVSETREQLSSAQAEQYYILGQTQVERGDLQKINNAINNHNDLKDARISILGGADELFMSEQK